jgi:hypothetical protein
MIDAVVSRRAVWELSRIDFDRRIFIPRGVSRVVTLGRISLSSSPESATMASRVVRLDEDPVDEDEDPVDESVRGSLLLRMSVVGASLRRKHIACTERANKLRPPPSAQGCGR